jgi:hypothetical protein
MITYLFSVFVTGALNDLDIRGQNLATREEVCKLRIFPKSSAFQLQTAQLHASFSIA